jgi:hypothetical protein
MGCWLRRGVSNSDGEYVEVNWDGGVVGERGTAGRLGEQRIPGPDSEEEWRVTTGRSG